MTTLQLYSKIKSNQRKPKERNVNHTRIIFAVFAILVAILILASCATDKSKYQFTSNEAALSSYHDFLSEMQGKKKLSADELVAAVGAWTELRDTVYAYISKDTSFHAHTYLPTTFFLIHDSIRTEMYRLATGQDRTLADVLLVKKSASIYNKEEDLKKACDQYKGFFVSLDSLDVFKTDKRHTLDLYNKFLAETTRKDVQSLDGLKAVLSTEDRFFRSFLIHLGNYSNESLADITKGTEQLVKNIYDQAASEKLDSKDVMVIMSMRTNRRLVQNAVSCLDIIRRGDTLSDSQKEAFFWMMVQPYIAIDDFGMAVLTPEQEQTLLDNARELQLLEKKHQLGGRERTLTETCHLMLKLYIFTL